MKITAQDARKLIKAHFPKVSGSGLKAVDAHYAIPNRKWLERTFLPYFAAYKAAYGVEFWTKEEFDCDDFALCFAAEARKAHRRTRSPDKPKNCTLAIGFMHFMSKGSGGIAEGYHAASVAIVWNEDAKEQEILTLEPQNGWTTNLTVEECVSCDFVYI